MLRSILLAWPLIALAAPVGAQTIQQDYETAQKALDARDTAGARAKFEALLRRMPANSKSRSTGVVKSRLGAALVLDGEQEAAIPLLTEALAIFNTDSPADISERAEALADRGRAHEALGQFADAAADYRAAHTLLKPVRGSGADIVLLSGLGRAAIWTDPNEARRILSGLIALPDSTWGEDKQALAQLHSLRGRVDLNDGDAKEAMVHFERAMKAAGGSTTRRVDLTDVRARADASIAAYELGRTEAHQKLVTFSGGGGLATMGLSSARSMELPQCGTSTGLSPDDMGVVEFAIGDDGRVRAATPIYVKRADGKRPDGMGGPEAQFVQVVRSWYWQPDGLAKIDPFWRQVLRVEMRCSNARQMSNLEQISMADDASSALEALGIRPMPSLGRPDAASLPADKAELQARVTADGPQSPQLISPLMRLAANDAASVEERRGWARRAIDLSGKAGVDPGVLAFMETQKLFISETNDPASLRSYREALLSLEAREAAARPDGRATQYVRLVLAEALHNARQTSEASRLLEAVVATSEARLGRVDPIRTAALLRLSNIAAARKDTDAAARALAATGLSPEQCALVDVRPRMENRTVSSGIFPPEAHRWGSGGLTTVEYDIGTDGKPLNARTVMATPPFVFSKAIEKGVLQLRYEPVFRPGNAVGCSGATQNFRFLVKSAP